MWPITLIQFSEHEPEQRVRELTAEPEKTQMSRSRPATIPEAQSGIIRVLVADDHTIVREGLVEILSKQPGIAVVGEAVDGEQAVEQARHLHPSVVLMDISLPRMSGIEATRLITSEMQDIHVIGFSMHAQKEMAARMRDAGAERYILKDSPMDELVGAIHQTISASESRRSCSEEG